MSDIHPHSLTLDAAALGAGLITAQVLRANIAALPTPPVILHLRCTAPEGVCTEVLVDAGFVQVGMTRLIKIALPLVETCPPNGFTFGWHSPQDAADWTAWYQAHWDSYRRTHPTNIAKDPGAGQYPAIFGGDDLYEALFAYENGAFIGFASLRKDQEIGWVDVCGADRDDTTLAAILAATLRRAAAHGWTAATLEVDDDHPGLWALSDAYTDQPMETFIIWQRAKA